MSIRYAAVFEDFFLELAQPLFADAHKLGNVLVGDALQVNRMLVVEEAQELLGTQRKPHGAEHIEVLKTHACDLVKKQGPLRKCM